jgi:hypothetical protein
VLLVLCLRLVDDNDVRVLRSIGVAEGIFEVLHTLFKRLLERWNIEDVILDFIPARRVGTADDGNRFLELTTTGEEFTVEPDISWEA